MKLTKKFFALLMAIIGVSAVNVAYIGLVEVARYELNNQIVDYAMPPQDNRNNSTYARDFKHQWFEYEEFYTDNFEAD